MTVNEASRTWLDRPQENCGSGGSDDSSTPHEATRAGGPEDTRDADDADPLEQSDNATRAGGGEDTRSVNNESAGKVSHATDADPDNYTGTRRRADASPAEQEDDNLR